MRLMADSCVRALTTQNALCKGLCHSFQMSVNKCVLNLIHIPNHVASKTIYKHWYYACGSLCVHKSNDKTVMLENCPSLSTAQNRLLKSEKKEFLYTTVHGNYCYSPSLDTWSKSPPGKCTINNLKHRLTHWKPLVKDVSGSAPKECLNKTKVNQEPAVHQSVTGEKVLGLFITEKLVNGNSFQCRTKMFKKARHSVNSIYEDVSHQKSSHMSHIVVRKYHRSSINLNYQSEGSNVLLRKTPPWRVMFFGTDQIAVDTLKELHSNMVHSGNIVESLDVVTLKEKTHRPVRQFADYVNLPVLEWPVEKVYNKYDVGILVSFGRLIPDSVIHMFPYGILNMHPSLLPRWRGASPIIHTVLNGDEVTGISVMEIRPKHFDIGPLLLQRTMKVPYRCTSVELADIMGRSGASMVMECLRDLPKLEKFEHEQDPAGITYAHKIKPQNANVDWENQTAFQVDCQYRALGFLFALKTDLYGHTVKLSNIVNPDLLTNVSRVRGYTGDIRMARPGTVAYHKHLKCLIVKCKEGIVGFNSIIIRKTLAPLDFYNGYLNGRDCVMFTSLPNEINRFMELERIPVRHAF